MDYEPKSPRAARFLREGGIRRGRRIPRRLLGLALFLCGLPLLGASEPDSLALSSFGAALPGADYAADAGAWRLPSGLPPLRVLASDATSAATPAAAATPSFSFDRVSFHQAAGWTSASLFLAAGIVGAVRAYSLMDAGHSYRDSLGITEDTMDGLCSDKIIELWSDPSGQALRWTHVGLIAAGETLYLSNAVSGIGMFSGDDGPGLSRSDIHRYAFFTHATLMAAELVLGVLTSDALSRGDHEAISEVLGPAHVAVGFAIPAVIFSAGTLMQTGWFASE